MIKEDNIVFLFLHAGKGLLPALCRIDGHPRLLQEIFYDIKVHPCVINYQYRSGRRRKTRSIFLLLTASFKPRLYVAHRLIP